MKTKQSGRPALIMKGCAAIIAAVFLTAGCGGGSSSPSTPSTPSVPSQPTTPSKPTTPSNPTTPDRPDIGNQIPIKYLPGGLIGYYGDSTVYGYLSGAGGQVAMPAPDVLAEALPAAFKLLVDNEGVNSSTACGLLNGTDGVHQPWQEEVKQSQAYIVIFNHAINDNFAYDVETYKGCLASLARIARAAGKVPIFETPNPTRDTGPGGLDVYVDAMRDVAVREGVHLIDQYEYLLSYLGGRSPLEICPDGLHPTQEVYRLKGEYAARALAELFS